jgi:drug/metabolite transporter (DMT)-like permease
LPVLVAAFAYPIGNSMVGYARNGNGTRFGIPHVTDALFRKSAFTRILLVTLGSIPFWVVLAIITKAPSPAPMQIGYTALVALFSGVIATGFFWRARHAAHNVPYRVAALDSTQAAEAVFTILGGALLFREPLPGWYGCIGIMLIGIGIFFFTLFEEKQPTLEQGKRRASSN